MSTYIGYEVRAFACRVDDNGKPIYHRVDDSQANLFAIYGHVGIFNWHWIEDVPDRKDGERRIKFLRTQQTGRGGV